MGTAEAARVFTEALVNGEGAHDEDETDPSSRSSPHYPDSAVSFDSLALRGLTVLSSSPGHVRCLMPVTREKTNRYGTLHGGCIATLVDVIGTSSIFSVSPESGVSLHISVDYLSPAPAGKNVVIDSKVVRVGRTIAVANVVVESEGDGRVLAQGRHLKHVGSPDASRVHGAPSRPAAAPGPTALSRL
jgi:acyl-coenzyme A thioesterase 13